MSFFQEDDAQDNIVPVKAVIPKIADPKFRNNVIDTDYLATSNIITSLSGFKWNTVYYRGVHGTDTEARGQSSAIDATNQQYEKTIDMLMYVTSPLTASQDPDSKRMEVTGSAHMVAFGWYIPNRGDEFIAQDADGRESLFEVVSTEKKSQFEAGVYEIRYRKKGYIDGAIQYDLDRKTVKTYYYRHEFTDYGQSPFIEDEKIAWVRNIQERYPRMIDNYFSSFFSNEKRTLVVPGQKLYYYDHFLNKAMLDFYMASSESSYGMHRTMNVSDDELMRAPTVFDLITKRDPAIYRLMVRKMGTTSPKSFTRRPEFMGIYHVRFDKVIYPSDESVRVDYQILNRAKTVETLALTNLAFRPEEVEERFAPTGNTRALYDNAPLIKPVMVDDYYIFSQAFYDQNKPAMSSLERQLTDYMERKAPNPLVLQDLVESHDNWDIVEQFYYTPFLLILMLVNLRGL